MTAPDFLAKKSRGERIVMITACDYPSAYYADQAGVDALLVGDSLAMTVLGHSSTIPLTLDEMIHHVRAVCRAQPNALVIADMPFLTYQGSQDQAVLNCGRLIKEGGAAAVKLEGGSHVAPLIQRVIQAGIPVMGHVGLQPQSVHATGGWRVQGRKPEAARTILEDARALEDAGVFGIVVEMVPVELAAVLTRSLRVPTIGIGAGVACDGQVQLFHDLIGMYPAFTPRHTRKYVDAGTLVTDALRAYAADVRGGAFPSEENTFHQPDLGDDASWSS